MKVYSATDVGQKREINQDYIYVSADPVGNLPNLFVVADGMGGHNAGDYASSHGVNTLVEQIRKDANYNPVKVIRYAIEAANTELLNSASGNESLQGMGTTMVVCTIVGQYAYVANIGDSRLYVVQHAIRQVTRDHSLVAEMVENGELTQEEAFNHPQKNMLTRGIGVNKNVNGDVFVIDIYTDDIILLCSDGLTDMLHDNEITGYLQMEDTEASADALLSASLEKGGKDNISFIILKLDRKEVEHDGR